MTGFSSFQKQIFLIVGWAVVLSLAALWLQFRQWSAVSAVAPTESLSQSIDWGIWVAMGGVWGLSVVSLFWLKRIFEGPAEEFAAAVREVQTGNYDSRVVAVQTRRDQWDGVYRQFREMQDSIKSRAQSMEFDNVRFRTVLASMNEGVLAIDLEGQVILANESARQLLMLDEDLEGRKLMELVRIPELRAAIEETQQTRQFQSTEFKTLHEPRKTLNARLTALADNTPTGVAIVFQDVTELRALETMRRDFVANVSHELKTPLASIKAYAETLRMGAIHDQEKNISFVEQIEAQADHLHLQIQDLMEIARVESGKIAHDVEAVSLNEACENCYPPLRDLASKSDLELRLDLCETAPIVMATEAGLDTILENLVSNAISYTPAGGKVIVQTVVENGFAITRVIDSGVGIDLKHHDRIFERFYRVDKARSRELGGTGLGLAIVKHLVQTFKGEVTIDSKIGKGTTFTVRLPIAKVPAQG